MTGGRNLNRVKSQEDCMWTCRSIKCWWMKFFCKCSKSMQCSTWILILWEATLMVITKQCIPKGVLPRRSGLGRILEFVMPFQNAPRYRKLRNNKNIQTPKWQNNHVCKLSQLEILNSLQISEAVELQENFNNSSHQSWWKKNHPPMC